MTSFEIMKKALENTGLYTITDTTRLYAELKAYDAGLQILRNHLEELEKESFISTASTYGLTYKEAIFKTEQSTCTLDERKEMLLLKGAVNVNSISVLSFKNALLSCGITAEVTESASTQSVEIYVTNVKGNQTQAKVSNAIVGFLPAHLDYTITFA